MSAARPSTPSLGRPEGVQPVGAALANRASGLRARGARPLLRQAGSAAAILAAALLAAGCGGESHQDLRDWMRDQGKGALGKLDPLPQIRPYEPFAYNAFDLPDPFKPRKIEPAKGNSRLAPDLARRREPLESYPLESLSMVGTLAKNKVVYALVRTPEKDIYQVRSGNFMGQNFGVVTGISDTDIKLKELVQDSAGDWTERSSTLQLQQPDPRTQGRKQ